MRAKLRAIPAAAMAAVRLMFLYNRLPLDALVRELRRGAEFRGTLRDPELHDRVVGRLLRFLPPWSMGSCLKRSLILFALWNRCGLHPRLHVGYRAGADGQPKLHAWLTEHSWPVPSSASEHEGFFEVVAFELEPSA